MRKYVEMGMATDDKRVEQKLDPKKSVQKYNHNPRKRYHALQMHFLDTFTRLEFEVFEKKTGFSTFRNRLSWYFSSSLTKS